MRTFNKPGRSSPRRLADALGQVRQQTAPATLLAAVQEAWPSVAGAAVGEQAEPVAERAGTVTIACRSASWAQELDLLGPELLERLNAALEGSARGRVEAFRFTADADRHSPR